MDIGDEPNTGTAIFECYTEAWNWRDNPLNLSILIGGGKETNKDSLSN